MNKYMDTEHQIHTIQDLCLVMSTNGIIYLVGHYGTPLISFCTAACSLYYIIRKIKKEFFSNID